MVNDADKYKEEDNKIKERIDAKNKLEGYVFGVKNSVTSEMKEKMSEDDREMIMKQVTETIKWLDEHQMSEKEEYEQKMQEIQKNITPIIAKTYQGEQDTKCDMDRNTEQSKSTQSKPKEQKQGPKIEEVD